MKYEFLKTEFVGDVEVAYLLDAKGGRLLKVLVEDFTNGVTIKREESIFERVPRKKLVPKYEDEEEVEEVRVPARPLAKIAPSILPAHLRGVFVEQDQPGAAVETRRV